MKQKIKKTLHGGGGMLYVSSGDATYCVASCIPKIELIEETEQIPRLGSGEIVQRKYAEMVLIFQEWKREIPISLKRVDGFGVRMSAVRKDGKIEMMDFPRCRLVSTLDLIDGGTCTFEIDCSDETLDKLKCM